MIRIVSLIIIVMYLAANSWGFGIVNNSGTTPADSISIPFFALDSAGNMVAMASGDSVFLHVYYPSGALSYRDSLAYNGTKVTSTANTGFTTYSWKEAVATIDGTAVEGVYSYMLVVKDNTSAALRTPHTGHFQLYADTDFDALMDELMDILDTLQNQDDWVSSLTENSNIGVDLDDVTGTLDSNEIGYEFLNGTKFAASSISESILGDSCITSAKIKSQAITSTGFANNAITSASIANGAFTSAEFANDFLTGSKLASSAVDEIVDSILDALPSDTGDQSYWGLLLREVVASLDSLQNQDNWVAKDAGLFDPVTTPVVAADTNTSGEELALMPDEWDAGDSAAYGGEANVDSASVARAVWNTQQANHTTSGTFGKYLDTEVSGLATGSGAYSVTLVTYDSSVSQVVAGAGIAVRNVNQSSLIAVGYTGSDGMAAFNLDSDSFVVVARAPGYLFTPYDTLVVGGSEVDTVFGYRFDPGSPASPSLCRVYGYLSSVDGESEQDAAVSAYLPKGVSKSGDVIVSPFSISTLTDSTGYFYLDLIPSDSLVGTDTRYEITISRSDGTILRKRVTVPVQSNWQLTW